MVDISIIVPIYNAEKFLVECIESLLNQTKQELEFILVNDGSTDQTEEIIKKYKDKRIKYFKNKNQGIGKTRNFGIDKATGKYIMFVDSDDFLEKDACEKLYKKMEKECADVVVCNFYKLENGTREEVKIRPFSSTTLEEHPQLLLEINLAPWNKLYRTELLKKHHIRFVETLKYEDAPFVVEALDKARKISYLDQPLNYYVIHQNSETTVRDMRVFDIIKIVDQIRTYFQGRENFVKIINMLTVRILTNYTIQQRMQQDKKIGNQFIEDAFSYLKKEVPDYKNNKYYEKRGFLRRSIEKSKLLTKLYCYIYRKR